MIPNKYITTNIEKIEVNFIFNGPIDPTANQSVRDVDQERQNVPLHDIPRPDPVQDDNNIVNDNPVVSPRASTPIGREATLEDLEISAILPNSSHSTLSNASDSTTPPSSFTDSSDTWDGRSFDVFGVQNAPNSMNDSVGRRADETTEESSGSESSEADYSSNTDSLPGFRNLSTISQDDREIARSLAGSLQAIRNVEQSDESSTSSSSSDDTTNEESSDEETIRHRYPTRRRRPPNRLLINPKKARYDME